MGRGWYHYGRRMGIPFPLLKDPGNRVADQFGAVLTPEAFVLDAEPVVRYGGRIDDQYGVGYIRAKVEREDPVSAYTGERLLVACEGQPVLDRHSLDDPVEPCTGRETQGARRVFRPARVSEGNDSPPTSRALSQWTALASRRPWKAIVHQFQNTFLA